MAKEVITINEPEDLEGKEFKEGSLLRVEGKVLEVVKDSDSAYGCGVCTLDAEEFDEYCACVLCPGCYFKEIKDHE